MFVPSPLTHSGTQNGSNLRYGGFEHFLLMTDNSGLSNLLLNEGNFIQFQYF